VTTYKHPLTGETVDVADDDLAFMRAELEAASGLDLSDMSPTSILMNYNVTLRRVDRCPHCDAERGDGYCQECGQDRDE